MIMQVSLHSSDQTLSQVKSLSDDKWSHDNRGCEGSIHHIDYIGLARTRLRTCAAGERFYMEICSKIHKTENTKIQCDVYLQFVYFEEREVPVIPVERSPASLSSSWDSCQGQLWLVHTFKIPSHELLRKIGSENWSNRGERLWWGWLAKREGVLVLVRT